MNKPPDWEKRCNHSIEGPPIKPHGRVVAWRKQCRRMKAKGESYCWQHLPWHPKRR